MQNGRLKIGRPINPLNNYRSLSAISGREYIICCGTMHAS
jgi:hypothetical protein